jgi:hypothetical protein
MKSLTLRPLPRLSIDTYDDHRMARAFSLVAAATKTIILDPDCTSKTFPGYFEVVQRLAEKHGWLRVLRESAHHRPRCGLLSTKLIRQLKVQREIA